MTGGSWWLVFTSWGTMINYFGLGVRLGIWTFRSSALSFPGAKSPQMELSLPWNFHSLEHSLQWNEKSKNFCSMELSHPLNFCSSGANVPRTLAPWNFRSLELSIPYIKIWAETITAISVRRRILAMVVGLRARIETFYLQMTQYIF